MKNTLIIFENSLSNLKKDEVKDLLEDLSFNLAYKQISHNPHETKKVLNSLLVEFLTILKNLIFLMMKMLQRLSKLWLRRVL